MEEVLTAAAVPTARVVASTADRFAAFRLRYDVYIAEQGKPYPEADHHERLLTDELDADGELIVAVAESRVVGTVRANWFDSSATRSRYTHIFELNRFAEIDPAEMAVCSRLAASMDHRYSRAREMLFESIYERGLMRNTCLCFATCAPLLARMFRAYGFREYAAPIKDPVVGTLHRTLLILDDLDHLRRIRSPFIPIAARRATEPVTRPWLNALFERHKACHESA